MQKITLFAIKANIATFLLTFLIWFIAVYILGDLFLNNLFAGVFALVMSYVSAYYATSMLLRNSHLTKTDAIASIKQTWKVYIIVDVVFVLFNLKSTLDRGVAFTVITALTFVTAYIAFDVLKRKQQ